MWYVYGIVSPISKMIFYVGCTSQTLERRLSQHAGDTCSAAYSSIQYARSQGLEPSIVVIDYFEDQSEALLFEQQMILTIKCLCNKQHKAIRERKLAAYMLEPHEIDGIVNGNPVTHVYRRFSDLDDVPYSFVGLPMSPENLEALEYAKKEGLK